MRWLLLSVLPLAGCGVESADLRDYVRQLQANPPPYLEPALKKPKFEAVAYQRGERISPFVDEVRQGPREQNVRPGCLGPVRGPIPPLARVALDTLSMRGTLVEGGNRWALVQGGDGRLHRVQVGDRLGLFGGRIKAITDHEIELLERVEQGLGCYEDRQASLRLQGRGHD